MLYDKRWDNQTKSDPFTLERLITWLKKQPADKAYNYLESNVCLFAQWLQSERSDEFDIANLTARFGSRMEDIAAIRPWTFGAALTRARAALPLSQRGEK